MRRKFNASDKQNYLRTHTSTRTTIGCAFRTFVCSCKYTHIYTHKFTVNQLAESSVFSLSLLHSQLAGISALDFNKYLPLLRHIYIYLDLCRFFFNVFLIKIFVVQPPALAFSICWHSSYLPQCNLCAPRQVIYIYYSFPLAQCPSVKYHSVRYTHPTVSLPDAWRGVAWRQMRNVR